MHLVPRPRAFIPSRSVTRLAVHLVWTTRGRDPLLDPLIDEWLAVFLVNHTRSLGCELVAAGNTSDHVHALVLHPPTVAVADLAQRLKGACTHEWNRRALLDRRLDWQAGYWAASCDPGALGIIAHQIMHQRQWHAATTLLEPWESALDAREP